MSGAHGTLLIEDEARVSREEAELARKAAAGDGFAFATLYDRYEQRIFNYCNRLLSSQDDAADATQDAFVKVLQRLPKLQDRELNFSAYLYTAARNASYDMIGRRKKAEPNEHISELAAGGAVGMETASLELDPERSALLGALQSDVQSASARLPDRQREVLALRELEGLSYDEIAEIMDMNRNSVAQLICRARVKLRDELRATSVAAIAAATPECQRALPLLAMATDGQLKSAADREFLEAHVAGCDTCPVAREAMAEAGASYRAWLPLIPLWWLKNATIAKAAEAIGRDWSAHFVDRSRNGHNDTNGHGDTNGHANGNGVGGVSGQGPGAVMSTAVGTGAGADSAEAGDHVAHAHDPDSQVGDHVDHRRRLRRRGALALLGAMLVALLVAAATLGSGRTIPPKLAAPVALAPGQAPQTAQFAAAGHGKVRLKAKGKTANPDDASVVDTSLFDVASDGTPTPLKSRKRRAAKSTGGREPVSKRRSETGGDSESGDHGSLGSGGSSPTGLQGGGGSKPTVSTPTPAPSANPTPTPAPASDPTPPPTTTTSTTPPASDPTTPASTPPSSTGGCNTATGANCTSGSGSGSTGTGTGGSTGTPTRGGTGGSTGTPTRGGTGSGSTGTGSGGTTCRPGVRC